MADKEKETKHTDEEFITFSSEDEGVKLSKSDSEIVSSEDLGGDTVIKPPDPSGPDSALDGLLTTIDGEITKFLQMVNGASDKEMEPVGGEDSQDTVSELGFSSVGVEPELEDEDSLNEWADASTEMLEALNKDYEEIDLNDLVAAIDEEIEHGPEAELGTEAQHLAQEEAQLSATEQQFIIFTLAGTEYAVPASNVTEVGEMLQVTPLPNVPLWLKGVSNLRGDIISIVDLRSFLKLESGALS
ncbi:MAG: chemotaxis protein CheW, partial [Desulfobulbaceae bacterium]|nr:chemotaxis protein CheW [Desulfobulbaceae bacterium]